MKQLMLMRHAKSSWADADLPDIDRPLCERGRDAADKLGRWFTENDFVPDQVLVSTAVRCQETWDRVLASVSVKPTRLNLSSIYMSAPNELLEIIKENAKGKRVLVLGHQPTIGAVARQLRADPAPSHPVFDKYPTGATTVLGLPEGEWSDMQLGTAHLASYITPKQIS